jgi:hypothetical protein
MALPVPAEVREVGSKSGRSGKRLTLSCTVLSGIIRHSLCSRRNTIYLTKGMGNVLERPDTVPPWRNTL